MEWKIGEIFEYNGEWYQCVIGHCNQCSFDETGICKFIGNPYCAYRNDNKLVSFKKLEKIGGPYDDYGTILQRFKIYTNVTNADTKGLELHIYSNNTIGIEIKPNKEDMEEKKQKMDNLVGLYSSGKITYKEFDKELKALYTKQGEEDKPVLKPFNLEAAKSGKPVCTRDGRKARIICFDLKNEDYPLVAAIGNDCSETLFSYTTNGEISAGYESEKDLMMLPEKKEGWINVYYDRIDGITFSKHPYPSKEEAIKNVGTMSNRINTVKISWEE